jgi:hypothetical protein
LKPKPAKRARLKACSFVEGLSDNHFAKLTKCVSCDIRWTTRKTVNQKKKHILSCAKKRGLAADTIRIAVLKENNNVKAAALKDAAEKEEEIRAKEASSSTLLEVTVNAAATKKRARHRPRGTVKSVALTRGAILKRAKNVLACTSQVTEGQSALLMDTEKDDDTHPPSTQQFGQSALANRCASEEGLFAAASINPGSKRVHQPGKEKSSQPYFEASSTEPSSRETSVSDTLVNS